ncbi:MBL fold metallo-hydrolase [Treponema sp.]
MATAIHRINLKFVNAYLVEAGDGYILMDTGLASQLDLLKEAVASILAAAGRADAKIKLIVLTHFDGDHVGNAVALRDYYGAPLAMHEFDAEISGGAKVPERKVNSLMFRLLMAAMGLAKRLSAGFSSPPAFKADVLLCEGEDLEAYDCDASVLLLAGHTPGSIGILTGDGDLLSGDALQNRLHPALSPLVASDADYEATLSHLRALSASLRTVYPGHGNPFPGSAIDSIKACF